MKIRTAAISALLMVGTLLAGGGAAAAAPTEASKVELKQLPQAAPADGAVRAAAADCYTYPDLPDRVSIDSYYRVVRVSLVDSCYSTYAYFDIYGPAGYDSELAYDPAFNGAVAYWGIDPYFTAPGTYSTPFGSGDGNLYGDESIVKFGSKAGLTAKRTGNRVSLTACASYYNGIRDAFVPWSGNKATIQQQTKSGGWQFVKTVTLNKNGCGTHVYSNKYAGTYRVTTYETGKVFARTSTFARA